nr:hypothetical protein [Microbispora sp. H10885]
MRLDRLRLILRLTNSAETAVAPRRFSFVLGVAKYSSPLSSFTPWHEKCSSSTSSGARSAKNSSTISLTTCVGSLSSVLTWKPPIAGSPSTRASASASRAGARNRRSPGSRYSSPATMRAVRLAAGAPASPCRTPSCRRTHRSVSRRCSPDGTPVSSIASPSIVSFAERCWFRVSQAVTAFTTAASSSVPARETTRPPRENDRTALAPGGGGAPASFSAASTSISSSSARSRAVRSSSSRGSAFPWASP